MNMTFTTVIENITEVMGEMDGEAIAQIHNDICSTKIRYVEYSIWEETGENDEET